MSPTASVNEFSLTAVMAITNSGKDVDIATNTPPTMPSDMPVCWLIAMPLNDMAQPAIATAAE